MAKIVEGVAILAAAIIFSPFGGGAIAGWGLSMLGAELFASIGASLLLGGIGEALMGSNNPLGSSNPGASMAFSIKQPAAPRQVIYGQCRIAGTIVYESSTNDDTNLNQIIAWAGHPIQSIDTIYLDGRAVVPSDHLADSSDHTDDSGNTYNFKGCVYTVHRLGIDNSHIAELGDIDDKWDTSCTGDGISKTYIRCLLNTTVFQGQPGVKANVHGKANIYDPRDATYKYTNNAALVIADALVSPEYGLGADHDTEIDWDHVAAMANLCDEEVTLGAGGTEKRYTINGFFDTSWTPGDIIDEMLRSCEGRLAQEGGKWRVYPAAYYGTGLVFFDSDLIAGPKWTTVRKTRDKFNAVRATFISPKYPYSKILDSDTGETQDQDTKDDSVWSGQWQPSDAPEYAQDVLHGYDSDVNLEEDGEKLYTQRAYRFVTSVAQCQRLMKIFLLRNRHGGTGTLRMNMIAYQLVAGDVFEMTFPALGWNEKLLEVQSTQFVPGASNQGDAPTIYVELQVAESDPEIYLWSPAEELGPENTQSPAIANSWEVNPPSNLVLESGLDSAVVGLDGVTVPRIQILWDPSRDPFVLSGGYYEIQWQPNGASVWLSAGLFNTSVTSYFLRDVVSGSIYNVRIRAVRSSGASSGWVSAGPHTVSITLSSFSYTDIAGLGALATRNSVDFASGTDVLNRAATHLNYSTGFSVESLRPAQAGAEPTTGKSLDILIDGGTYARVKGNQLIGGTVTGKSYGSNMLGNPSFESNTVGTPATPLAAGAAASDEWTVYAKSASIETYIATGGRSGTNYALIRIPPGVSISTNDGCRVVSTKQPVLAGTSLYLSAWIRLLASVPMQAGASLIQRVGVMFFDASGTFLSETTDAQIVSSATGGLVQYNWTMVESVTTTPVGAAFACFYYGAIYTGLSGPTVTPGLWGDMGFDDCLMVQQTTTQHYLPHSISANYAATDSPGVTIAQNSTQDLISIQVADSGSLSYTYLISYMGHFQNQVLGGSLEVVLYVTVDGTDIQSFTLIGETATSTATSQDTFTLPLVAVSTTGDPLIKIRVTNQSSAGLVEFGYLNITALKA